MHLVFFFLFFFLGACQCFVNSESPNLHRHQKKTKKKTTGCPKPAQTQKKQLKFPGTMGPLLSTCWIFFFGACRCVVHLVVCFFDFCGACQCFVMSKSPNLHRHQKKQKKQATGCTKPAQTPKKTTKISRNYGSTSEYLLDFFLFFFGACRCLMHLVVCFFFCFFWCLSMCLYISCQDHDENNALC